MTTKLRPSCADSVTATSWTLWPKAWVGNHYCPARGFVNVSLGNKKLKSVRVHFAYGRIALMLELLGRFGRFLDEDDRCNPPVLLIPFPRLLGL